MNKHFRSCKKCEKPLKRHALKAVIKNTMMEPSRAWIKNVGAGTSRELPKKHLSRSRLFVKAPIPTLLTDEIYDLTLDDSIDPKGTKGTQNVQRVVKLEKMDKTTHTSANKPIPNVDETVSSVQNDNTQHDDTAINNTIVANVIDQNTLYKTCSENNVSSFGSDEMARTSKENLNGTTINSMDNTITAANQKPSGISVLVNDLNDSNDFKESNTNDITIVSNINDKLKNVNVRRNTIRSIANTFSPPTPDPYRSRANGSVEDSSVLLNSTEVSETFIKLDRATHFLRNFNNSNASLFLNGDDSLLDVTLTPMSVPSSYGVRKTFDSPSCKRVPPSPFVPKGGFIHQVYMSEEDFNVFTQNGNIFFHEGKPHYQQKLRK